MDMRVDVRKARDKTQTIEIGRVGAWGPVCDGFKYSEQKGGPDQEPETLEEVGFDETRCVRPG